MRYLIALLAACGPSTPAQPTTKVEVPNRPLRPGDLTTDLSPALRPLSWWLGDWNAVDGNGQEHWIAADGAIYGVSLLDGGRFEAIIVDDASGPGPADGVVRLFAMPGGMKSVEFRAEAIEGESALFANPAHDDPKKIGYARTADSLRATIHGDANRLITFDFTSTDADRVTELERADIAFSDDVGKRGVEGWMAAFDANGWMMRNGERVSGAAIGEMMTPVLADGTLAWKPIDSGVRGELGFTVGKARFVGKTPADSWRSTYVTIWKQQPDKSWKVLFDVGRPVNE